VIRSFGDAEAKILFETGRSRKFQSIESVAKRKLDMIDAAAQVEDLRVPPGNRLELLKGTATVSSASASTINFGSASVGKTERRM
jgi:plasmid maintenance system killer protein